MGVCMCNNNMYIENTENKQAKKIKETNKQNREKQKHGVINLCASLVSAHNAEPFRVYLRCLQFFGIISLEMKLSYNATADDDSI